MTIPNPISTLIHTYLNVFQPQAQLANGKSEEQAVQIHPCSVNFNCPKFESPWLVYAEMVSTSAVYLRDCTMV